LDGSKLCLGGIAKAFVRRPDGNNETRQCATDVTPHWKPRCHVRARFDRY